ncbi:hypothetical protein [Streptomyces phaeochromogenes]
MSTAKSVEVIAKRAAGRARPAANVAQGVAGTVQGMVVRAGSTVVMV